MKNFPIVSLLFAAVSFSPNSAFAFNNFSGVNINAAIGATAFYDMGIYGQNVSVANIEAGHFWTGHETLNWVPAGNLFDGTDSLTPGPEQEHATAVAFIMAGRAAADAGAILTAQDTAHWGVAPGAALYSGNIATKLTGGGGFEITENSLYSTYAKYFGTADVINSSWGSNGEYDTSEGIDIMTLIADLLARKNPTTTMVAAAGNSGPGMNTVSSPAVSFNVIAVGALNETLDGTALYSSRAPSDFYLVGDPDKLLEQGRKATVHLVAPGTGVNIAYTTSNTAGYITDSGTSYAAPTVAGVVALLDSYSREVGMTADARDSRVIKAVLMNSAQKFSNWDNGTAVANGVSRNNGTADAQYDGVRLTTQALDFELGAGALDAAAALEQYTRNDVFAGWRLGEVSADAAYELQPITVSASTVFTVTLTWFAVCDEMSALEFSQYALANLDLEIWTKNDTGELGQLLALSATTYDNVEHLQITFEEQTEFVVRVVKNSTPAFDFNNGLDKNEKFAIAWNAAGMAIPEPQTYALFGAIFLSGAIFLRRRNKK